MSDEEDGKIHGVAEERLGMVLEDIVGREGDRIEVQEYGLGRSGPLDRGSGSAPPLDGCNVSGGLRLPLGRNEPLNQPSRDIIGSAAGNMDPDRFQRAGTGCEERNWRSGTGRRDDGVGCYTCGSTHREYVGECREQMTEDRKG